MKQQLSDQLNNEVAMLDTRIQTLKLMLDDSYDSGGHIPNYPNITTSYIYKQIEDLQQQYDFALVQLNYVRDQIEAEIVATALSVIDNSPLSYDTHYTHVAAKAKELGISYVGKRKNELIDAINDKLLLLSI